MIMAAMVTKMLERKTSLQPQFIMSSGASA
jgi:hypothetical protein